MAVASIQLPSASFDAEIVGFCRKLLGPTLFKIRVAVLGGESFVVQRRYSCFQALHSSLQPLFTELPPMPPKSKFRKCLSPSFMESRERGLKDLLRSIIAIQTDASDLALRHFFGLIAGIEPRADDEEPCANGRRAAKASVADLMSPTAELLEVCSQPTFAVARCATDLTVVFEDEEGDDELYADENTSGWDAHALNLGIEKLKLQNAQLQAENVKISKELAVSATGASYLRMAKNVKIY